MSKTQAQRGDEYWREKQKKGSWTPPQTSSGRSETQAQQGDRYWKQKQEEGSWTPQTGISSPKSTGQSSVGAGNISSGEEREERALESYRQYLYDTMESEKNARKKAIARAEKQLNSQIPEIRQEAEETIRQANINKILSLRDLPQQLAAMGSSGGATDSAVLGIHTAYENSRNEIAQNRDRAIQDVRDAIAEVKASGDTSLAQIENQYRQALAKKAVEMGLYGSLYGEMPDGGEENADSRQKRRNLLTLLRQYGADDSKAARIFSLLGLE